MVEPNSEESISRRNVLKRTAGALAVGGGGLAASESALARRDSGRFAGVTCGTGHSEGTTFTVESRCEGEDCDVIRLNGLAPACVGEREEVYADLPGTEPTVWMNVRAGEVPPRTYRVVETERCEPGAGECSDEDLYRLAFRPTDEK
ncbi:twin-arginine translocation signal domain-containing protein [Halorussus salinus]|uniref:twin-arginine translocation signal domain-containing protein n=1 Tax=Halorussus salinus TaxID=1364935 RepID=UPI00109315D9|nr:twin-arginine translocation signal domain-containing protein [Halorussus salinus]